MAINDETLKPLADAWLERWEQAKRHRSKWDDVCTQCRNFYQGSVGFMWEDTFRRKYLGAIPIPKFRLTVAKAFELVAIVGPTLFWRNPERKVVTTKKFQARPEHFGNPNDPMVNQIFQMQIQQEQMEEMSIRVANELMEYPLNYFPFEQPGGGLPAHSILAITEALIYGRGCLWTQPYSMPGSKRKLIGSFYETSRRMWVDPDCQDPTLTDAMWICRENILPVWEVERRYGYKRDELRKYANCSSEEAVAGDHNKDSYEREYERTYDMIRFVEFWSKGGCGVRFTSSLNDRIKQSLDEAVGDYSYIACAPDCPFPLNAPPAKLLQSSDRDVRKMMEWPIPTWIDNKWPVKVLDFYPRLESPYPVPLLEPGLGELTFMNIAMSFLANRVWNDSREITAVLKSAAKGIVDKIKSGGMNEVVEVEMTGGPTNINEIIQQFQRRPLGPELYRLYEMVSYAFDKRTGLTELAYGLNPGGVASRSAADIQAKQQGMSIRPQYLANCTESWQEEVADMEKFCLKYFITGEDIYPLLGRVGSQLWNQHITQADPELFVRGMRARVVANSIRKPNKDRDISNLQIILPTLFPEFSKHADITHDTNALNALIRRIGEVNEFDVSDMQLGQRQPAPPPPPPPEIQQQQQMQMQMGMQLQQAQINKVNAEAQATMASIQFDGMEAQAAMAKAQADGQAGAAKLQIDMAKMQGDLQMAAAKGQQEIQLQQAKLSLDAQGKQAKIGLDAQSQQAKLGLEQVKTQHGMRLREEEHQQALKQKTESAMTDMGMRTRISDLDFDITERRGGQKSRQDEERHVQEMRQKEEDHRLNLVLMRRENRNGSNSGKNGSSKQPVG